MLVLTIILNFFKGLWSKLSPYALILAAAAGAFLTIRKSGKDAAYKEIAVQQKEKADEALKVTQKVSSMSDADVAAELHKFNRD